MERLVLKANSFTVEVLPALGGKIASMQKNGVELLQQPLLPYAPRTATMSFDESDASGFDECLPSVAACEIDGPAGKIAIPDHGEFWRLPCQIESHNDASVRLAAIGSVLPLRLERSISIESDPQRPGADILRIGYWLENIGETNLPYAWSAHPLFAVDAGDRIVLPSSVTAVQVEGSAHNRLGPKGTVHSWPSTTLADGETVRLDYAGDLADDIGDKLYAAAPPEGWCQIERKRAGLRIRIEFDPAQSPYLGLWLCYGGWPEGHAKRQQSVALEPCTAPDDSLATGIAKGWARTLEPGQSYFWRMNIIVDVVS
jgi:galactose mutarotase-like enzyme